MKLTKLARFLCRTGTAAVLFGAALNLHADYASTVLGLSPIAYWRMNETTPGPQLDMATNSGTVGAAANGFYVGSASHPMPGALVGSSDTAASFTRTTAGSIQIPWNAGLNPTGAFTMECWANATVTDANNHTLVSSMIQGQNPANGNDRSGWNLRQVGTDLQFQIGQGLTTATYNYVIASNAVVAGVWQHSAVVFNGSAVSLFTNGVLATNYTLTFPLPTNYAGPTVIGDRGYTGWGYDGWIDEVAIYPSALSAADLLAHYQNGINPTPSPSYSALVLAKNPTGYYRLNEPTYTPPDPSTYPVTANSATTGAAADGVYWPGTQPGAPGVPFSGLGANNYAGRFLNIGGSGYVKTPAQTLITSNLTITCWIKRNGSQSGWNGLLFQRNGTATATGLSVGGVNDLRLTWNDGDWPWESGLVVPDNQWTFAAVVISPTNAVVYMNSRSAVDPNAHGPHDFSIDSIYIGQDPLGGRFFSGLIDEMAVFNQSLTPAQIQTLFTAANVPPLIMQQPQAPAGNVYEGMTVALAVVADGNPTLAYQWTKNGTNLIGKASATLTLANVVTNDTGNYAVVITNNFGTITSSIVALNVQSGPPVIFQQPQSVTRLLGAPATFSISAGGSMPVTYQWKLGTNAITGATNATYTIAAVSPADAATNYNVLLTNPYGTSNSANATLTILPMSPYTSVVMSKKPYAYWRMGESSGSTAFDYAGGHDGTFGAGVTRGVSGPQPPLEPGFESGNLAFDLDGAAGAISIPAPNFNTDALTITCWIKPNGLQTNWAGLVYARGGSPNTVAGLHYDDAQGLRHSWNDQYWWNASGLRPKTNQWNFAALVVQPDKTTIYLDDGSGLQSWVDAEAHTNQAFAVSLWIGEDSGFNNRFYNGTIDEVAVFSGALSQDTIWQLSSAAVGRPLKLDLQVGAAVKDSKPSGTPHDGVDIGATWLASSKDAASVTRSGVMQFVATNRNQIIIPWNADFNTTNGAITFWMRSAGTVTTNGGNDGAMIIDRRQPPGDVIVQLDTGNIFWQPEWIYNAQTAAGVNDDNWHHVAYVFDQGSNATILVYMDGNLDTTAPPTTNGWTWSQQQIEIGLSHDAYWRVYDGQLDDIRFYNRILTAAEVQQIFTGDTSPVTTANMVGRYNFDGPPSGMVLKWPAGTLQSADSITGPWNDVPGATSPWPVRLDAVKKFYRLKI